MHSLLALPSELLHQVASSLDVSDVASLASTCRTTRLSVRSLLFRSMTVASAAKLESLACADMSTLGSMRHFTLRLEYDFFEAFAAACEPTAFPHCTAERYTSLLPALAHILLSAPQLSSLRVSIPDNREDYRTSAWTQLLRFNTNGIALGPALVRALPQNAAFPALRVLHLDGVSQLAPLVRMTPNLVTLSAHMCEGFAEDVCRDLVEHTLPLVPCLEELAFDPFSLHFASAGFNVPKSIMAAAPGLRTLDLRSRAYDFSTGHTEWRTTDSIDPLDCVPANSRLRELHLPFTPSANEGAAALPIEPLKAILLSDRARETELLAVVQLASTSPLEKVSWLRADAEEPVEYEIQRDEHGIPVQISVTGSAEIQPPSIEVTRINPRGFSNSLASIFSTVASSTTFHAAFVMWLMADSSAVPIPSSFATPALLATGLTLGLVTCL